MALAILSVLIYGWITQAKCRQHEVMPAYFHSNYSEILFYS